MKNNIYQKIIMLIFLISMPHALYADPLSNALESWDPVGVYGIIMAAGKDSLVVNEKMILVIDEKRQGKIFKTSIMNLGDKQLNVGALKKGVYVAINGTGTKDSNDQYVVIAKEIYVLPGPMSAKELKKYQKLQHPVESW